MSTEKMKRSLVLALPALMCAAVLSSGVRAGETDLRLQVNHGLIAGVIPDGTVLARGEVTSAVQHAGFLINAGERTGRGPFILEGHQDKGRHLKVRVSGEGWIAAGGNGETYVLHSTEPHGVFSIVADGEQYVAADTWSLALSTAVTE